MRMPALAVPRASLVVLGRARSKRPAIATLDGAALRVVRPTASAATRCSALASRRRAPAGQRDARGISSPVRMVIFSGIQPTGRKHLGNYIGAIRSTSPARTAATRRSTASSTCTRSRSSYDPAELRERVYDTTAILLAAGLDPERCILFRQGDVHEHTELCWLLLGVTAIGELNRMHQFRDKSVAQRELVARGLLFYPVLQAADVLAYRAARGAGGGGPARAPRADARRRAALQRALRRDARRARAPDPDGRRAHRATSRSPSARCRRPAAPSRARSTCSTSRTRSAEVQARGDRLRAPRSSAAEDKPGISNLIEILAAVRGVTPEAVEREFADAPLRRLQGRGRRRGRRLAGARARALRRAARATRPRSRTSSRPAPRRRARSRRRTLADVREAMGVGPAPAPHPPAPRRLAVPRPDGASPPPRARPRRLRRARSTCCCR